MALKVVKFILVFILVLGLRGAGLAAQEAKTAGQGLAQQAAIPETSAKAEEPKEENREKTLEGEVAGVSPNFLAVDYGQDQKTSYEMTFNITKDTRLERITSVKSLKPGDTVWVSYNEKVLIKGKEIRVLERVLKVLRLLNSAKVAPEPVAPVISNQEEDTEDSQE